MKLFFSEEQKNAHINTIELEDILFTAYYLEGDGKKWIMNGLAVVDGETYDDFTVEIQTLEEPSLFEAEEILNQEWDYYDYIF